MKPNELEEVVVELRIGQAVQGEQIQTICDKIDVIDTNVKDIHNSLVADTKNQNSQLKTWLMRAIVVLLGGGATAGGVQAIMAMLN